MRPQDNRSQQSGLSLCDQDSGIRKACGRYPIRIVRCRKRSTHVLAEALAKPHQAGEAYRRHARVVALEARIRVDHGIIVAGLEIWCDYNFLILVMHL